MQARCRLDRARLAKPKAAPFGVAVAAPPLRVLGELQDVRPSDGRVRPAQRLRHRFRHREDKWRLHQAGGVGRKQIRCIFGAYVLAENREPAGRGGRPHGGLRAVSGRPPAGERRLRVSGGERIDPDVNAVTAPVVLVVVVGEPGEEVGLLLRGNHHDSNAVGVRDPECQARRRPRRVLVESSYRPHENEPDRQGTANQATKGLRVRCAIHSDPFLLRFCASMERSYVEAGGSDIAISAYSMVILGSLFVRIRVHLPSGARRSRPWSMSQIASWGRDSIPSLL